MSKSIPVVPYQCTGGPSKEILSVIVRKISASLSVFGSSYILITIVRNYRHKGRRAIDPYQRIMFGLSTYDIIWSFFPWFLGSWMTPRETGWWGAIGNTRTCTMQGFFFWLGVPGAQYYQILLSLHTLLLVTFKWKLRRFHKTIERWAHVGIFVVALILATVPLFYEGYNPECGQCLPAPLPIWCGDWYFWGDGTVDCMRGEPRLSRGYYTIYLIGMSTMSIFCTGAMVVVYATVRRVENRAVRISLTNSHRRDSKRIRRTMILYTFAMYGCWVVPSFIIHFARPSLGALVASYILVPLQGFFNMLIFIAPKCAKYQRDHPGTWIVTAYARVIFNLDSWNACDATPIRAVKRHLSTARLVTRASTRALTRPSTTATTTAVIEEDSDDDDIGFNHYNEDPPQGEQIMTQNETNDGCRNKTRNNLKAEDNVEESDADPEDAVVNKESLNRCCAEKRPLRRDRALRKPPCRCLFRVFLDTPCRLQYPKICSRHLHGVSDWDPPRVA